MQIIQTRKIKKKEKSFYENLENMQKIEEPFPIPAYGRHTYTPDVLDKSI